MKLAYGTKYRQFLYGKYLVKYNDNVTYPCSVLYMYWHFLLTVDKNFRYATVNDNDNLEA
jgi:hypothetical protein